MLQEKICIKCKKAKPISAFSPHTKSPIRYQSQCKECRNAFLRKQRRKIKEKLYPELFISVPIGFKRCSKCGTIKTINEFHKRNDNKKGLRADCKECVRLKQRIYLDNLSLEGKTKRAENKRQWSRNRRKNMTEEQRKLENKKNRIYRAKRQANMSEEEKEKIREKSRARWPKIKARQIQKRKQWWKNLPIERKQEMNKLRSQQRREARKSITKLELEEKRLRDKEYMKKFRAELNHRLAHNLRVRLRMALRGNVKNGKAIELLSCSIDFFKEYIEKQFKKNMSWDNYGEWHLDHIYPCSSFDLTDEKQLAQCFRYNNFQPLWSIQNSSKKDKIPQKIQYRLL